MLDKRYLYLTAISEQHNKLTAAECLALTGAVPDADGIAISNTYADVKRGAYVKSSMELLFEASHVSDISQKIKEIGLYADDFRVSVVKRPRNLAVNSLQMAHTIGGAIEGKARLEQPRVVFLAVVTHKSIYFGKLLSESDGKWVVYNKRPHVTSSSLPARIARVMVNLIAQPGDRLVDPCCGTGTIVLEAANMAIDAVGYDTNLRMVGATQKNLAHFGLKGEVHLDDARHIRGQFDAIATDLPYGISLVEDTQRDRDILRNLHRLAPKAAFVDTRDLHDPLTDLGYRVTQIIPAPKHTMVRRIYITSTVDGDNQ